MAMNDYNDADQERERKRLKMSKRAYQEAKFGTLADKRNLLNIAMPLVAALIERCARVADRKASLTRAAWEQNETIVGREICRATTEMAEAIAAEIRTLAE